jgi:hypothetical protein
VLSCKANTNHKRSRLHILTEVGGKGSGGGRRRERRAAGAGSEGGRRRARRVADVGSRGGR